MSLVRSILVAAAGVTLVAAPLAAQKVSPFSGIWKLNLARSTFNPVSLKPKAATIVKFTVSPLEVSVVSDGVDSQGRKTHAEYTAKCDGTVAPWRGTLDGQPNPDQDGISVKCLDFLTLHVVNSLQGKPTTTLHNVVTADGRTRTVTVTGANAQGVKVNHTLTYVKQ